MIAALLVLVAMLPASVASDAARLELIERGYALDAAPHWEQDAEAFADRAAPIDAAHAHLWLGARASLDGRLARAQEQLLAARTLVPSGPIAAQASRGLGDVALARHAWLEASERFHEALAEDDPTLARELHEKIERAQRGFVSFVAECVAWLVFALCVVWFARLIDRHHVETPIEAKMLAPVYALCAFTAWGRDPHVPLAIVLIGLGSLLLVTVAFATRHPRRRLAVDMTLMLLGNVAVLYLGLRRAGVADALWETLKFGTDMG